jgi:anti-anti-sigma factor
MSVRDQAPGTASFAVRVQPERDVVCILPEGELDLASVAVLEEQVAELIDAGFMRLVIDLRGLTFMDVSGVRLLLGLARQARGGGCR